MERKNITVDDLLATFKRYWIPICFLTALAGGIVGIREYLAPIKYRGTTTILVITPNVSAAASQLAVLSATASTPLRMIKGIMVSDRETRAIIDKFKLDWRKFENDFDVTDESQTNQLVISYDSADPDLILKLLQFSTDQLALYDQEFNFTVAGRQAITLKSAVEKKEIEYDKAQNDLLKFQKTMVTASDPSDPKSVLSYLEKLRKLEFELGGVKEQLKILRGHLNAATANSSIPSAIPPALVWQKKLADVEYKLRIARTSFNEANPEVVRLKRIEEQTKAAYKEDVQKYLSSINKNLDPDLAELEAKRVLLEYQTAQARAAAKVAPDEALKLSRYVAEVVTLRTVLTQLRSQYEQAKIESEVSRVRWNVLDPPYIQRKPVNKRYRIPVLSAAAVAFTFSMCVAFARYRKTQKA